MTIKKHNASKILSRIDKLPLYLHAYAYHLNMRVERILPNDLLDIAHQQKLSGVKIHVLDGESRALQNMSDIELAAFKDKAHRLNLDVNIETSSSDKKDIDLAVDIALKTGSSSVRFYPRYEGHLQDVMAYVTEDIRYLRDSYAACGLTFVIEQHEDLTSAELMTLVQQSGMPNLSILFDFANMINANEKPLEALETLSC